MAELLIVENYQNLGIKENDNVLTALSIKLLAIWSPIPLNKVVGNFQAGDKL